MKDLFLTQGHLEAQPWQTPPLPSVETKVGRVERQRGEGGETCESWTAGGGKGGGKGGDGSKTGRRAQSTSWGWQAGSLLTDWMSLSQ